MLERYGDETWFRIGDADLATHVRRDQLMAGGASLTDATAAMATALGVPSRLVPATDDRVRTMVRTDDGELDFQTYFVRRGQADEVRALRFEGVDSARPSEAALTAIGEAELIVIGPSNPLVSIGPILAIPGMRDALTGGERDQGWREWHRGRQGDPRAGRPDAGHAGPRADRPGSGRPLCGPDRAAS